MIRVESHISIKKDDNIFLNSLNVKLLHEISLCGSLRSAAKKLEISYQHAWSMVKELNRIASQPIVVTQRGGVNGGCTIISSYGSRVMNEYKQIENQIHILVSQINVELNL